MAFYYLCSKCGSIQDAPQSSLDSSPGRFHLHRNAWWPLLIIPDYRAEQLVREGQAEYKNEEPMYTADEMYQRKSAGSPVQEQPKAEAAQAVPVEEVFSCDWD